MEKKLTREEKATQTRARLLQCAEELFIEQGFVKTTISQIIKRAGLGYGTAYVYFKNKDELFVELLDELMGQFYDVAERSFVPKSVIEAAECIKEQVGMFLTLAQKEHQLMRVLKEARGASIVIDQRWSEIREQFIHRISVDISYAQSNGLASRHLDPELIARGWFYANEMFMWECVTGECRYSIAQLREQLTDIYMNGLYIK
ncbi:TetR/AcrR family transcriptional regulator [Alkalihalophilus lindianensis]|uniref:TetR/AcrR family transcriptional regulator n=1 Tax=Alkalihalophilus lindianensis TaxID=1630542 RepID=A0ABU3XD12_9BACI|nr:TetR/AcrR family transcriptional regulator [Alkalihalophilus lindianensis]MDV2685774.1 TetR/AcrR family transcriptional regulator [Alkalihalophilus lindianensis]